MSRGESEERPFQVYVAAAANITIAVCKVVAALTTGSSAMLSEGFHSIADTGNQLLLLYGLNRSKRPPDRQHSFGHGKEIYFWGFVVAMLLFTLGGGLSIYEGVNRMHQRVEESGLGWNYVVLGVAAVAESTSMYFALRKFRKTMEPGAPWWHSLRASKDPNVFLVIAEDAAGIAGIAVAAVGVSLEHLLRSPVPDAVAAIVIGGILCAIALLMARETKGLLVGETADGDTIAGIQRLASNHPHVVHAEPPLTMHLAPDDILVNMTIQFSPDLPGDAILLSVDEIENRIRGAFPDVHRVFIEAASLRGKRDGKAGA